MFVSGSVRFRVGLQAVGAVPFMGSTFADRPDTGASPS
ncbi:unnamed protein product [[Actinomadura] parvosata subsp. kistnae]|nr:unnamed protein product [Actinomadura parvosata subsp. kistnae]